MARKFVGDYEITRADLFQELVNVSTQRDRMLEALWEIRRVISEFTDEDASTYDAVMAKALDVFLDHPANQDQSVREVLQSALAEGRKAQ